MLEYLYVRDNTFGRKDSHFFDQILHNLRQLYKNNQLLYLYNAFFVKHNTDTNQQIG